MEKFNIEDLENMKIFDDKNKELKIQQGFPDNKLYTSYRINNTLAFHIIVNSKAAIIFQLIQMSRGVICISDYIFNTKMTLTCTSPNPVLEFFTTIIGRVNFHLQNDTIRIADAGTFNCITTPSVQNKVTLSGHVQTMDCHLDSGLFEEIAALYPKLQPISKAKKNKRFATLFPLTGDMTLKSIFLELDLIRRVHEGTIASEAITDEYRKIINSMLQPEGKLFKDSGYKHDTLSALREIINHIHENPEESYTIDELTRLKVNESILSPAKIREGFREILGKNPAAYMKDNKITKAKYYLEEGISESKVAELVGYKHLTHFERDFKLRTNQSVKKYKEAIKNQRLQKP